MNGISCFVNFKENLSKNVPYYKLLINRICEDNKDVWISEDAALGACSKSSITTKICEGYQFTIAFFGELSKNTVLKKELDGFGYHFLSEKDAELALCTYIHYGEKCIEKLCGDFSFIIYDAMRRQIFAFSRSPKTPLFYGIAPDGYVISSSLCGVLACPGIARRVPSESILSFISVQSCIPNRIFENVYYLKGSSCLKISCDRITEKECVSYDPEKDALPSEVSAMVLSGTNFDLPILKNISGNKENVNIYGEVLPCKSPLLGRFYPLSIDKGTLFCGLETSVSACGFPVLSNFDYLLAIAIRAAQGTDDSVAFLPPDRFSPPRIYLSVLIDNNAFHPVSEGNLAEYKQTSTILPDYTALIGNFLNTTIETPHCPENVSADTFSPSPQVRTALRHLLLDIISKDHAPILAFLRRSALLNLCEGKFRIPRGFSESELIAYLIKLNIWFQKYRPALI